MINNGEGVIAGEVRSHSEMKNLVVFGGTGFIGLHYALKQLREKRCSRAILADIKPISSDFSVQEIAENVRQDRLCYVPCDVRKTIDPNRFPGNVDLVANFAAVHREPGHSDEEYFETNVAGATNVCGFAEQVCCRRIIFTSSISVYSPSREMKSEETLPAPVGAYGKSKLAAEKIHQTWKARDTTNCLVIVRPGVVFGSGERGNVTRMIQGVRHHYFSYIGNRKTVKASIYVKELCSVLDFLLDRAGEHGNFILANGVVKIPPTIEDYIEAICRTYGRKYFVPSLSYPVVLMASSILHGLCSFFGVKGPVDPVRVRKLIHDNNILPGKLGELGYRYSYSLDSAFNEWRIENPSDWS